MNLGGKQLEKKEQQQQNGFLAAQGEKFFKWATVSIDKGGKLQALVTPGQKVSVDNGY